MSPSHSFPCGSITHWSHSFRAQNLTLVQCMCVVLYSGPCVDLYNQSIKIQHYSTIPNTVFMPLLSSHTHSSPPHPTLETTSLFSISRMFSFGERFINRIMWWVIFPDLLCSLCVMPLGSIQVGACISNWSFLTAEQYPWCGCIPLV